MFRLPLEPDIQILVAGPASALRERVAAFLRGIASAHVEVRDEVTQKREVREPEADGVPRPEAEEPRTPPDLVVLTELGSRTWVPGRSLGVPIVGCSESAAEPQAWLDAGAWDVFSCAEPIALVTRRVRGLVALHRQEKRMSSLARQSDALTRIHAISAHQGDSVDALREILGIALDIMGFDRASLIAHVEGSEAAYVIAATDAPEFAQFAVAVDKYPEIKAALDSKQPVLLDDAQNDPVTASVADLLATVDVRGMAVFPAVWMGTPLGVLMFRSRERGVDHLDNERCGFARVLTYHLAVCLHHGKVMESLRESTTHRMSRSRYEAERRLRTIDSLKEHFEASADGVLILDEHGRLIFVNRAGESILGFARHSIMNTEIESFVRKEDEGRVRRVIARVIQGQNIGAFDLDLLTHSGETICASVTTSTVLGSSGAAVLSFRDVTAQRALEAELRHTKEFLEKLVDSTVDAIVAADMRGNVIIFNQGAERIHGYRAAEVIGRIPVSGLYPGGVARQIMRMLRSTQYGGVGRLEQTRREIKSKSGELVPVNMTASIIYQDGREVATVGIFSDLRERIRIEQRLLQAQEKLQMTEKQALVAELAGVAAHELNQPLTSIMGYAELLLHRGKLDPSSSRPVQVILDEAERMAEIVKKIGRITKYETKVYVGSTLMLDLDRSSRAPTIDPATAIIVPDDHHRAVVGRIASRVASQNGSHDGRHDGSHDGRHDAGHDGSPGEDEEESGSDVFNFDDEVTGEVTYHELEIMRARHEERALAEEEGHGVIDNPSDEPAFDEAPSPGDGSASPDPSAGESRAHDRDDHGQDDDEVTKPGAVPGKGQPSGSRLRGDERE